MKTLYPLLGLLPLLLLLSGCNEYTVQAQKAKLASIERQQVQENAHQLEIEGIKLEQDYAHQLEMEQLRLENEREMAIGRGRFEAREAERNRVHEIAIAEENHAHEIATREQFYAVFDPLTRFLFAVAAIAVLVWSFLFLKAKIATERMVQQFREKEVAEEQETMRQKYKLALAFVGSQNFGQLSDDHKEMMLKQLETLPTGA